MRRLRRLVLGLILSLHAASAAAQASPPDPLSVTAMISLLRQSGQASRLAEELVTGLGIPRAQGEAGLGVKGKAFVQDKITRTAFVPTDAKRQYLILIEENASGTIFLLTSASGKAEKAFMNTVTDASLRPLPAGIAEQLLKHQIAVWQYVLKPQ